MIIKSMSDTEKKESTSNPIIFKDIPIKDLDKFHDCTIIYQTNNLKDMLFELMDTYKELYKHSSMNNKIRKIDFSKNSIIMMVDPNFEIKHYVDKDLNQTLNFEHINEICESQKIDFKNQPITSVIQEIMNNILNKKTCKSSINEKSKN